MSEHLHISDIDSMLLDYLEGRGTDCSAEQLRAWIAQSAEHASYVAGMCEIWFSSISLDNHGTYDAQKAYAAFRKRTHASGYVRRFLGGNIWYYVAGAAACLLLAVCCFWGKLVSVSHVPEVCAETPVGKHTQFTLPDGTRVWLNGGSKLSYATDFGKRSRLVHISGEGYFQVAKDPAKPFVVQSKCMRVTALGTTFDFCDYPENREINVSLVEGMVQLDNLVKSQDAITMNPEEYMSMNKSEGVMKVKAMDASSQGHARWMDGILAYDEMLLSDIVNSLMISYEKKIQVVNADLLDDRYRGIFNRNTQNIYQVLDVLSKTSKGKIHYKDEKDKIIIY